MLLQIRQGASWHLTVASPPLLHPSPCSQVCPSLACILSRLSRSVSTHISAFYTGAAKLEFWPLLWASPTFSVGNQAFNTSFVLGDISTVLSVSRVAITRSAGKRGEGWWRGHSPGGGPLSLSLVWACWRREDWHNEILVLTLVQKADSGEVWPSRRSWGEDGCSPLMAGSGIFCHTEWIIQDSCFSSSASCWGQCQGSLALPLEASPCCEKRWEQSILPLISNSGQSGGKIDPIGKMRVCFSGGTVIHLVFLPSACHPEWTVCWSHRPMSKTEFFKVLVTLYNNSVSRWCCYPQCNGRDGRRRTPSCKTGTTTTLLSHGSSLNGKTAWAVRTVSC